VSSPFSYYLVNSLQLSRINFYWGFEANICHQGVEELATYYPSRKERQMSNFVREKRQMSYR